MRFLIVIVLQLILFQSFAQKAEIYGTLLNSKGKVFNPTANIALKGMAGGTTTNSKGNYKLEVLRFL